MAGSGGRSTHYLERIGHTEDGLAHLRSEAPGPGFPQFEPAANVRAAWTNGGTAETSADGYGQTRAPRQPRMSQLVLCAIAANDTSLEAKAARLARKMPRPALEHNITLDYNNFRITALRDEWGDTADTDHSSAARRGLASKGSTHSLGEGQTMLHRRLGASLPEQMKTLLFMRERFFGLSCTPEKHPQPSYGLISYTDKPRQTTFARITPDTSPQAMVELLVKHLGYRPPRLVVSVTGGAADFHLPRELDVVIQQALRKAVEATDAWIITGGMNCGVMAYTGGAVCDLEESNQHKSERLIPCIGIATWGKLHPDQRAALSKANMTNPIVELSTTSAANKTNALESNHSHIFLVDSGQLDDDVPWGTEIPVKKRFEHLLQHVSFRNTSSAYAPVDISDTYTSQSKISGLLLVIEGGPNTLTVVRDAVDTGTAVLVVEGSGRVADLLAYAWRLLHDEGPFSRGYSMAELERRVRVMGLADKTTAPDFMRKLLTCVAIRESISLYTIDQSISDCMLEALLFSLKSQTGNLHEQYEKHVDMLRLAMSFGRVDIAADQLHEMNRIRKIAINNRETSRRKNTRFPEAEAQVIKRLPEDIKNAVLFALTNNMPDMVMLLVKDNLNNLNLGEFLYENNAFRLAQLYRLQNNAEASEYLRLLVPECENQTGPTLVHSIDRLVHELLFHGLGVDLESRDLAALHHLSETNAAEARRLALHDLVLWSVLMNHYRLANFFWNMGGLPLQVASVAARLYSALSRDPRLTRHGHLRDTQYKFRRMGEKFAVLARGVLDNCYDEDSSETKKLLRIKMEHFHEMRRSDSEYLDVLELAMLTKDRALVSHTAAQAVVEREWNGELSKRVGSISVLFNIFLWMATGFVPVFLWLFSQTLIPMRGEHEEHNEKENAGRFQRCHWCDGRGVESVQGPGGKRVLSGEACGRCLGRGSEFCEYTRWERVCAFVQAPVTKVWLDSIFFLLLLLLYSATVLEPYGEDLAWPEVALAVWFLGLIMEEVREVFVGGISWQSIRYWWRKEDWNKLDTFMLLGFVAAFILRIISVIFEPVWWRFLAKAIASLNLIQVFVRLLRYYALSATLGPNVIVLSKMLKHLVSFLGLLGVFLLPYGIASHALLFPDTDFSRTSSITQILFRPYFALYGELQLDSIEQDTACIGQWAFSSCDGTYGYLVPMLLAAYLVVSNIMLVNLLIALFATELEKVQASAVERFSFQQLLLLEEYRTKPILPPPLSSVILLFWLLRGHWCDRRQHGRRRGSLMGQTRGAHGRAPHSRLERFQQRHKEVLVQTSEEREGSTLESRMKRLETMHQRVWQTVSDIQSALNRDRMLHSGVAVEAAGMAALAGRSLSQDGSKGVGETAVEGGEEEEGGRRRFLSAAGALNMVSREPVKVKDTSGREVKRVVYPPSQDRNLALPQHMDPKTWQTFAGTKTAEGRGPLLVFALADPAQDLEQLRDSIVAHDRVLALTEKEVEGGKLLPVVRQELRDEEVPWSAAVEGGYQPPYYTAPFVLLHSMGGPCLETAAEKARGLPCQCAKHADSEDVSSPVVQQRLATQGCRLDAQGYPLNPAGRTGLRGRGQLYKWGPNHAVDEVVVRWKRDVHGLRVERAGKPLLEVVVIKRKDSDMLALPGSFTDKHPALRKAFDDSHLRQDLPAAERAAVEENVRDIFEHQGVPLTHGAVFMDDHRNTDNAWVETTAVLFIDRTGHTFDAYELKPDYDAGVSGVAWCAVQSGLQLFAQHLELLRLAAELTGAYF